MEHANIPDPEVKDAGQRASVSEQKKVSYTQQDKYMRSVRGGMIMACAGPAWLIIQAVFGPSMYSRFGIRFTFEEYLTYNVNEFMLLMVAFIVSAVGCIIIWNDKYNRSYAFPVCAFAAYLLGYALTKQAFEEYNRSRWFGDETFAYFLDDKICYKLLLYVSYICLVAGFAMILIRWLGKEPIKEDNGAEQTPGQSKQE